MTDEREVWTQRFVWKYLKQSFQIQERWYEDLWWCITSIRLTNALRVWDVGAFSLELKIYDQDELLSIILFIDVIIQKNGSFYFFLFFFIFFHLNWIVYVGRIYYGRIDKGVIWSELKVSCVAKKVGVCTIQRVYWCTKCIQIYVIICDYILCILFLVSTMYVCLSVWLLWW